MITIGSGHLKWPEPYFMVKYYKWYYRDSKTLIYIVKHENNIWYFLPQGEYEVSNKLSKWQLVKGHNMQKARLDEIDEDDVFCETL